MKKLLIVALCCLTFCKKPDTASANTSGQSAGMSTQYVATPDGLVLRDAPNRAAKKITIIPHKSAVQVGSPVGASEMIATIRGNWVPVKFGTFSGFAFDGFLGAIDPASNQGGYGGYGH